MGVLEGLQPAAVFEYFEEICRIPHGSGNTGAISAYCVAFAKKHGLFHLQDAKGNIMIFKNGTPGYEDAAPVMLQGHLDMVCEKEADCEIDFAREGLRLQVEDGIVSAKGTTLGGDDGIAIAYALAILASDQIMHPPIEAVFTVDEEIGMLGAAALDCAPLKARTMLNIDSEEEGCLLVSCAGGVTVTGTLPVERTEEEGLLVTLSVQGLLGGHSGTEIDKGRANACKLLGRILHEMFKECCFGLVSVDGGLKDNAIPREAKAELLFHEETEYGKAKEIIKNINRVYKNEYQATDPQITVSMTQEGRKTVEAMTSETRKCVMITLASLPNGVQSMSGDLEGLVETSLNLGILATARDAVSFTFSVRSSVGSEKQTIVNHLAYIFEEVGGTVSCQGDYPAWEYKKNSRLRDLMTEVFCEQYGRKPVIRSIHAGVECGLFAEKLPGLDCVSFGPDMLDIHTPKERMDVKSVQRTWTYLLEVLKRLK